MRLRIVRWGDVEAALTCFPATERILVGKRAQDPLVNNRRVMEALRKHGATLKEVMLGSPGHEMLSSAVGAGALPNLTSMDLDLKYPICRQILSDGMLGLLEAVEVTVDPGNGEQLAALEHLRHLAQLRGMSVRVRKAQAAAFPPVMPPSAAFPPFIPPSLKTLSLDTKPLAGLEALLHQLPSMLQMSGVSLEKFELRTQVGELSKLSAEAGAACAQVL
jgi:hypothetical protein